MKMSGEVLMKELKTEREKEDGGIEGGRVGLMGLTKQHCRMF